MKIKQMFLWQLLSSRVAFIIFFCIITALTTILTIVAAFVQDGGTFNMSAASIGVFFLFVAGCASFAENLHIAFGNGVSRRTHFLSFLLFAAFASALTAVLGVLIDMIPGLSPSTYTPFLSEAPGIQMLFFFTLNLGMMALGYFFAGAYYRMNKAAKIAVSIIIPVTAILCIVFIMNAATPAGPAFQPIPQFIQWMLHSLTNAALFWLLFALLFLVFGWLVTRRAGIRHQQAAG
ncbi:hypothetical protein [Christensenella tenuis]|uniref:ABC transporter permease n=1 Tax=Christensenella tenuis TaxID=2763033 RepID=A0ABR7EAJ0_9FIRM|nr:hypothetical protein [Christensenella tenuis]MBC5646811.1 hypothetical protein [Christensenella tenuis]